ncbi:MAG: terminase [Bradyrhizobium sp.]|nr:MAG: terminase [Bradyrhizobium sp.]
MNAISPEEYRTLLRTDFCTFLVRCFAELNGGAPFQSNWHIEVMAAQLQRVRDGRCKRLIINIPPRHLKSLAASIALPAWMLGHDPTKAIANVTYGEALSDKFARDCRSIMTAAWYRQTFATRLVSSRASLQELLTTRGGFRLATSVGGVLTGRGADVILIDDPLKPGDAMSESRRVAANEWYDNTLYSRLNDKARGAIVVVMQRLHEDDLVGHVLRKEGWDVLSFPAIAEIDERYVVETPFGRRTFVRQAGQTLHPERESLETLEQIRTTLGTYNFAGQYQQNPSPSGGGMVKEAWFHRYTAADRPASFDQILQSWDTASKPSELSDYSVCTTWGLKGPKFYLLNVFRKKLAYPDLKRAVQAQSDAFHPTSILIEDAASGTQLIQELLEAGLSKVVRYKAAGDKIMRLHAQTATIENGFVSLPDTAHWLADYLHELCMFPNGRHDDQVDSTAQALAWTKQRPPGWGMLEYCRQEAEKAEREADDEGPMVRLLAPADIGSVQTWSGRHIQVPLDRVIELSTYDAGPLKRAGWLEAPEQPSG